MRVGRALVVASLLPLAVTACSERPLPGAPGIPGDAGLAGAAGAAGMDGGAGAGGRDAAEAGVPPGLLGWAIPVGTQADPMTPGSTAVTAVVGMEDGGAIVAGSYKGSVRFAPDYRLDSRVGAGFLARYRSDQRFVWASVLSASGGDVVVADIALVGGSEVVAVGWFGGTLIAGQDDSPMRLTSAGGLDIFVARFAGDGSVRWLRRAGGPGDDIARGVAAMPVAADEISVVLTGAIEAGAVFGPGEPRETRAPSAGGPIFAARLDSDGNLLWARFAGGGIPGQGYGIAAAITTVAVTGYVNGPANFGSNPSGAPVTVDPANGRAFVARWDAAGGLAWAQPLAGPQGEGDAIAIGAAGEIVVAGLFEGTARFGGAASAPSLTSAALGRAGTFLAALSADGSTLWARSLASSGVRPWRVRAARGGGFLLAASFGGGIRFDPDGPMPTSIVSSGSTDALCAALAADGAPRWLVAGGGPGDDRGSDVASALGGATYAVGDFFGPATFGAGSPYGAGISATLDSGTDGGGFLLRMTAP
jgi:hypothetical protein